MYIASVDDTTMAMTGIGQYDDAGEEHCTYTEQYGQCTDCCNEVVTLSLEANTHLVVVVEGYWHEDEAENFYEGQIHIAAHQIDTCLDNSCDQFGDDDDYDNDDGDRGCLSYAADPSYEHCHSSSSTNPADVFQGGSTLFLSYDEGGLSIVWYSLTFTDQVTITSITLTYDAGATGEICRAPETKCCRCCFMLTLRFFRHPLIYASVCQSRSMPTNLPMATSPILASLSVTKRTDAWSRRALCLPMAQSLHPSSSSVSTRTTVIGCGSGTSNCNAALGTAATQ